MIAATDFLEIANRGATGLLLWSWQALVLITCVWFGLKVFKVQSPTLRHHVWLFSLIAVALLPSATEVSRRFPSIRPANPSLNYVIEVPRMVLDLATSSPQTGPVAAPFHNQAQHSSPANSPSFLGWPLLFGIWLVVALVGLARLAKEQFGLQKARKRAIPITARDLGIPEHQSLKTRRVGLRLSFEIDSPLLYGVIRPTILLPADIAEWTSPNERSAMIQHELAHVERLDPCVNVLQTALRVIFSFHPLVRYACRQLSLERELACDDRVLALGASAETYAEGLLKVAERSLMPGAGHQLAFFSAKQVLERRIEMILNNDRVRTGTRNWKVIVLSAGLIAVLAWLLIPNGLSPSQAQLSDKATDKLQLEKSTRDKVQLLKALGENKAFDDLIEMALKNPDAELRTLAAVRLTELEGDGSTQAMVELYNQTADPQVKKMLIDKLAKISEIGPLTRIAESEPNVEYQLRAARRIKWLKASSESADVRAWDVSVLADQLNQVSAEPPPPPPPPSPFDMAVEDNSLSPLRGHKKGESVFILLRELAYAAMRHDTSFYDRVLDDTYVGTMPDGETRTKAEETAEMNRRDRQITRVEFDEFDVSEEDGIGAATVSGRAHALTNGHELTLQQRYTVHFKRSAGQIKITAIDRH